jgi:hypothetical protein
MGQYFIVVNPVKKQYIDAGRFGENIKRSGILVGEHAAAVGLLLCDAEHPSNTHPLVGSWVGDPVIITGDYAPPNPAGILTTTQDNPGRNLYQLAEEEFEDISQQTILMLLSEGEWHADDLVNGTKHDSSLLVELGQIVFRIGCDPLRESLERILGKEWPKKYKEAREKTISRRRRITSGKHEHTLMVDDLIEVADLAGELKNEDLDANVEVYVGETWDPSDAEGIRIGKNVPPEIAVRAIEIAHKMWPFLKYITLSSEDEDVPEFVHNSIFFGAKIRGLRAWTDNDFNGLERSMGARKLHEYVRSRYGSDPGSGKGS